MPLVKRKPKQPRTTAEHAAAIMQPIIDGTRERGSIWRLRQTFHKMTGETFHAATWFRWLAADEARRMEPAVGTALAIQAAFEQMRKEDGK